MKKYILVYGTLGLESVVPKHEMLFCLFNKPETKPDGKPNVIIPCNYPTVLGTVYATLYNPFQASLWN